MTYTSQVEIERKYDVDAAVAIPALGGVAPVIATSEAMTAELDALYYDTAEFDLARESTALRRREGGADAGWHLKRPAAEGRTEVHWPAGDTAAGVPADIVDFVREIVGSHELVPIARVRNTRSTVRLLDAVGVAIAELCDDRVRANDLTRGTWRSWREWEVELLPGAPDTEVERTSLLDTIEVAVRAAGAHPSSSVSKLARALGRD